MTSATTIPSQGNALYPSHPPMRLPFLSFIYRLECTVQTIPFMVGAPHGNGVIRSVVNILGGSLKGPKVEGKVLPGGADWAQLVSGTHSMTLDARYMARTVDGEYLYIKANGLYRPGPETSYSKSDLSQPPPPTVTQDDVEFFTHVNIEAGPGKYNWLNGLVCIGVLICEKESIIIDVYHLTNFPDREPESVLAKEEIKMVPK